MTITLFNNKETKKRKEKNLLLLVFIKILSKNDVM